MRPIIISIIYALFSNSKGLKIKHKQKNKMRHTASLVLNFRLISLPNKNLVKSLPF